MFSSILSCIYNKCFMTYLTIRHLVIRDLMWTISGCVTV